MSRVVEKASEGRNERVIRAQKEFKENAQDRGKERIEQIRKSREVKDKADTYEEGRGRTCRKAASGMGGGAKKM